MPSQTMPSFTTIGITEEVEVRMRSALKDAFTSVETFLATETDNDVQKALQERVQKLSINKVCYDTVMKRLKKQKRTSVTFEGDDYPTKFELRDGKLYATDPKFPSGRETVVTGSYGGIGKPLSLKGLLMSKMSESDPDGEYANTFNVLCHTHNCNRQEAIWAYTAILAVNSFAVSSGWKLSGTTENMIVNTQDPITRPEELAFHELIKTALVFATNQSKNARDITEEVHINEDPCS